MWLLLSSFASSRISGRMFDCLRSKAWKIFWHRRPRSCLLTEAAGRRRFDCIWSLFELRQTAAGMTECPDTRSGDLRSSSLTTRNAEFSLTVTLECLLARLFWPILKCWNRSHIYIFSAAKQRANGRRIKLNVGHRVGVADTLQEDIWDFKTKEIYHHKTGVNNQLQIQIHPFLKSDFLFSLQHKVLLFNTKIALLVFLHIIIRFSSLDWMLHVTSCEFWPLTPFSFCIKPIS